MIGKVSGRLDYIAEDHALIEAAGVGYVIYASPRTLASLPQPGEPCALYTELVVREDLLQLFGFPTLAEKEWHRLLTSVQGVGPRSALAIVGLLGPEGTGRAIVTGDTAAVRKAPGVGPKLAQRIVLELRDKAPTVMALGGRGARAAAPTLTPAVVDDEAPAPARRRPAAKPKADDGAAAAAAAQADALSALVNLGYPESQAAVAVAEAAAAAETPPASADLIRAALRALAPK
ncbi:Holliday junction branch migration protein RuvA [Albimonas sp. CAU 1670]|uniref:Holliday junction branch migration protein RuvA n=1 Tax=Albimonas sp. CAU 1670 TaxID=3032599 RepID=UPI0023D9ED96|nr:Holliday junction branch migration protein RuvA [Albimonas sp. CAU 1670]MDF2233565.1 Holliday junction branch migration protein RuvA [Albimonas sp. CAU 1670]